MGLLIGTGILIVAIIASVIVGIAPVYALIIGAVIYAFLAHRDGHSYRSIGRMMWSGAVGARIVIFMMAIVGFLTASWRMSGTICYFVYYGVKLISPQTFIIIGYLLACLLSFAVGSSFATAAAVGVIFMALARAGGVNELIMGGAILSGIYFGDRASPSSSAALLVASVTETDHMSNVRRMTMYSILPLVLCLGIYTWMSVTNPISSVDGSFLIKLSEEFNLTHLCMLPAAIMLILPFLKVSIVVCMGLSLGAAVVVALTVQGVPVMELVRTLFFGYESATDFGTIFNGGGFFSMIEVVMIAAVAGAISGIFSHTDMLDGVKDKLGNMVDRTGRFFSVFVISNIVAFIACNQLFPTVMTQSLFGTIYEERGASMEELASDMQNSFIVTVGLIPWSVACSVPRSFMDVGVGAIFFAFYLMLVPLCYAIQKPLVCRLKGSV